MRILHITASLNPMTGGVCQAVKNLARGLQEMGMQNEVLCLDPADSDYLRDLDFIAHPIGAGISSLRYNRSIDRWLNRYGIHFDILVIHGMWQYYSYAVFNFWQKLTDKKIKLFVMPHGMLDPYFQTAPDRRIKAFRNQLYWNAIESRLVNSCDAILFTCEEEMHLARTTFPRYLPKRQIVVGLGVEAPPPFEDHMKRAFLMRCQTLRSPYFLFLSRIHPKKGVDQLVQAYSDYLRSANSGTYEVSHSQIPKLVIAGPGLDTRYGREVFKLVSSDAVLASSVFFPGMLAGDAKWGSLYGCEAFILPSHQENFGLAIVEAMACSKAVLISTKVNIWREVVNTGSGIASTDDIDGVKSLFQQWHALTLVGKDCMRNAARETFSSRYSIQNASATFMSKANKVLTS